MKDNIRKNLKKRKDHLIEKALKLIETGVLINNPESIEIRGDLVCEGNITIDNNCVFEGKVTLSDGVKIGFNCFIRDAVIGSGTVIEPFSIVDGSKIGANSRIGPYGRLRPNSVIESSVQIGNFVEIKSSSIGSNSRINHHSFIGDTDMKEGVTVGAGVITCNHDGQNINKTLINKNSYIGSNCSLIAPLNIGEKSIIGAGSVITKDTAPNKLTLARSDQKIIENWNGPISFTDNPKK